MTPGYDRDPPLWLAAVVAIGLWLLFRIWSDEFHLRLVATLAQGVRVTVVVSLAAFAAASALGLGLALAQFSRWLVIRQAARFYVEIMRGVPIMVLLLYVAFVLVPALVAGWNWVAERSGLGPLTSRDVPFLWRAVLALALAYAAFLAEVFRAGIRAVPGGQIEAAAALGLKRGQVFRLVIWPQAFRTILPPWGNDFVAMVKDSSLVSVLGVTDVTQLGKLTAAGNFRYFETYNLVALVYLAMTVGLSLALRRLERRLRRGWR